MKRTLLAALIGGIIAFAWSSITHMVLPTGMAGLKMLPQEEAVLGAMKGSIPESGLYFFPGMDPQARSSKEAQAAWEAKMRAGPHGLLLYHPEGAEPMPPRMLILEFLTDVAGALIAALILAQIAGGRVKGALIVMSLGLFGWLAISASYWIWYSFPGAFVMAEALDQVVGWFLAGLVMAGIVRTAGRERRFA
jgi:hypothetical protein